MIDQILMIILYSFFSGIAIIIGAVLARSLKIKNKELSMEVNHGMVAFGGGVLIAAVAFVLTPIAIERLSLIWLIPLFFMGSFTFYLLDRQLTLKGGSMAQVMAMMMDFIPEVIALGAIFAHDHSFGLLLALFIGLQNLPEGYNSYGELLKRGYSANKSLIILLPLSLLGIIAALSGNYLLSDKPDLIAALMLFSGGGIVYLMFQDIAPMSKMKGYWGPALGASFGFLIGMIGVKLLG